ncbi:hypothetical protein TNCV_1475411 [Trichonephila clavipes]|nr:hypothetical protein TNCV_1475411 [Trichonephila clavipes]
MRSLLDEVENGQEREHDEKMDINDNSKSPPPQLACIFLATNPLQTLQVPNRDDSHFMVAPFSGSLVTKIGPLN